VLARDERWHGVCLMIELSVVPLRYALRKSSCIAIAGLLAVAGSASSSAAEMPADITLPPGFSIEVLVDGLPNARAISLSESDTLFVGTRRKGRVYAVSDVFDDDRQVYTLATKRSMPSGVAFHDGDLYVGELSQIVRFKSIEDKLAEPGEPEVVIGGLPTAKLHAWKHIEIGPDEKLYVPLGVPCNICNEEGFGTITRYDLDGANPEVVATGIRNTVGMTWHPETAELWFTDNGRDMFGQAVQDTSLSKSDRVAITDDTPPDELNRVETEGDHFGFPFCHAGDIAEPDPKFSGLGTCDDAVSPVQKLGPHVAALGLLFYDGEMFPDEYQNQIFIAEHGSWNRSEKLGYRITLVRLNEAGEAISYEPFAEGWLDNGTVKGRPVDLLIAPDGALLISDDQQGLVYRISYQEPEGES